MPMAIIPAVVFLSLAGAGRQKFHSVITSSRSYYLRNCHVTWGPYWAPISKKNELIMLSSKRKPTEDCLIHTTEQI